MEALPVDVRARTNLTALGHKAVNAPVSTHDLLAKNFTGGSAMDTLVKGNSIVIKPTVFSKTNRQMSDRYKTLG